MRYLVIGGTVAFVFLVLLVTGVLAALATWLLLAAIGAAVLYGMTSSGGTTGANGAASGKAAERSEYATISEALRAVAALPGWQGAVVTNIVGGERIAEPLFAAIETEAAAEKAGEIDREIRAYKIIGEGPHRRLVALPTEEGAPGDVVRHITLPDKEARPAA